MVTSLGKEKNSKVPLFEQEDDQYLLTREGRLALGLAEDDDLEDWAQVRAAQQGTRLEGTRLGEARGKARGKDAQGAKGAAAASELPLGPVFVPPPPPPDAWVFPSEGDRIDVEVGGEDGAEAAWVTAEILTVHQNGAFRVSACLATSLAPSLALSLASPWLRVCLSPCSPPWVPPCSPPRSPP